MQYRAKLMDRPSKKRKSTSTFPNLVRSVTVPMVNAHITRSGSSSSSSSGSLTMRTLHIEVVDNTLTEDRALSISPVSMSNTQRTHNSLNPASWSSESSESVPSTGRTQVARYQPGSLRISLASDRTASKNNTDTPSEEHLQHKPFLMSGNGQPIAATLEPFSANIVNLWRFSQRSRLPDPTYLQRMPNFKRTMRATLIDWMIQVGAEMCCNRDTVQAAIIMMERYFTINYQVETRNLQLVAVTALWIADKAKELVTVPMRDFVDITDEAYTAEDMIKREKEMLNVLDWHVDPPCVDVWVSYYCENLARHLFAEMHDGHDSDTSDISSPHEDEHGPHTDFKSRDTVLMECQEITYFVYERMSFILELAVMDVKFYLFDFSELAAAALLIALRQLHYPDPESLASRSSRNSPGVTVYESMFDTDTFWEPTQKYENRPFRKRAKGAKNSTTRSEFEHEAELVGEITKYGKEELHRCLIFLEFAGTVEVTVPTIQKNPRNHFHRGILPEIEFRCKQKHTKNMLDIAKAYLKSDNYEEVEAYEAGKNAGSNVRSRSNSMVLDSEPAPVPMDRGGRAGSTGRVHSHIHQQELLSNETLDD